MQEVFTPQLSTNHEANLGLLGQIETSAKLESIGLTYLEYLMAYDALKNFDSEKILDLANLSRVRSELSDGPSKTTKELHIDENGNYTDQRLELHRQIVDRSLKGLVPEEKPKIIFIVGPSGAGKTTFRKIILKSDQNFALTCPDEFRSYVYPEFNQSNPSHINITQDEVLDIVPKVLDKAFEKKLNIISESTLRDPAWIYRVLDLSEDYETSMVLVHTPLNECLRRVIALRDRPATLSFLVNSIASYDSFFKLLNLADIQKFSIVDGSANFSTIFSKQMGSVYISPERMQYFQEYLQRFSNLYKFGDLNMFNYNNFLQNS